MLTLHGRVQITEELLAKTKHARDKGILPEPMEGRPCLYGRYTLSEPLSRENSACEREKLKDRTNCKEPAGERPIRVMWTPRCLPPVLHPVKLTPCLQTYSCQGPHAAPASPPLTLAIVGFRVHRGRQTQPGEHRLVAEGHADRPRRSARRSQSCANIRKSLWTQVGSPMLCFAHHRVGPSLRPPSRSLSGGTLLIAVITVIT